MALPNHRDDQGGQDLREPRDGGAGPDPRDRRDLRGLLDPRGLLDSRDPRGSTLDAVLTPAALSLYRMVISLLFTCHGAATVLGAFGGPAGGKPAVGHWPTWWAGLIQLVCGALVFLGVGDAGTRLAALLSSGSMAYAYFTVHQKHDLWPIENGGEPSVLFCWSFLLIVLLGPGVWTLSAALSRAGASPGAPPESA